MSIQPHNNRTTPRVVNHGDGTHSEAAVLSGTREYSVADKVRVNIGAASVAAALPPLSEVRELYVLGSARCFFRTGDSNVSASAATAHPLPADERFHLRIPAGHTHIAVIRDAADGVLDVVPVA
jgi:hypothetical protein